MREEEREVVDEGRREETLRGIIEASLTRIRQRREEKKKEEQQK